MKVGYFGNIFLSDGSVADEVAHSYLVSCVQNNLNVLICTGGISYNYVTTLKFIESLAYECDKEKITFGFIIGNTDLYYSKSESYASKEEKFREVINRYREHKNYLPSHPIFLPSIRINGFETWYDYSLYRGNPIDLKDITKKSKYIFFKNKDVEYITDSSDYTSGINNTFDNRYATSTFSMMKSKLDIYEQRWGHPKYNVSVMYFSPSKVFLKDSFLDKYFGSFQGSMKYMNILQEYGVTDCILGLECKKDYPKNFNNIRFFSSSKNLKEVSYTI